jgi:glycosyltransferase involved in cell wall biosynthesis
VRILLVTDSFPPNCGGSGWSTYELARGLRERGHEISIVRPRPGHAPHNVGGYDGFDVDEIGAAAPAVPFIRNYFKNERLWRRLEHELVDRIRAHRIEIVHGQHVLSSLPAIAAAAATRRPSIATVRDYWPLCYWADLILDPDATELCPSCTAGHMTRCLRPHAGALWPLTLPAIPYMRANLTAKRRGLAAASAVIAVSSTIAHDLAARAPELANTRVERIPNPVDIAAIRAMGDASPPPMAEPYVLYSGKLEINKGADLLIPAAVAAQLTRPLAVVGDGKLRERVAAQAREAGLDVRMLGWLPRDEALRWVRHAGVLVFPSRGPESLSRVLLEAGALGVPIAAMDTGGTRDIIDHERTGLLSSSARALGADLARLIADRPLAARLGHAARDHVEQTFDARAVIAKVEALYLALAGAGRRDASHA